MTEYALTLPDISPLTVPFMLISMLICFGFPLLGFFLLKGRRKRLVWPFFAGMLGFFIPQILIRVPILNTLESLELLSGLHNNFVLYALILAFSAALFETAGRYLVLGVFLKRRLSWRTGIISGLGHGGIEAVLLVGLNYGLYVLFLTILRLLPVDALPEQLYQSFAPLEGVLSTLSATPPSFFLWAGYERLLTIIIHAALSLMLTWAMVSKKTTLGLLICLAAHTVVDFVTVFLVNALSMSGQSILWVYIPITLFAAAGIAVMVLMKKRMETEQQPERV